MAKDRTAGGKPAFSASSAPADWRWRDVMVPGWAVALKVPRYICRIDGKATHGWQVRYPRGSSSLFSDLSFGTPRRLGTPADSLNAAMAHLALIWKGAPARRSRSEFDTKSQPTGLSGVRIVWSPRAGKNIQECKVRVDALKGGYAGSFYVGTNRTFTRKRLEDALALARAERLKLIDEAGLLQTLPDDPQTRRFVRKYRVGCSVR